MTTEEILALVIGQKIVGVKLEGETGDRHGMVLLVDYIALENGVELSISEPVSVSKSAPVGRVP